MGIKFGIFLVLVNLANENYIEAKMSMREKQFWLDIIFLDRTITEFCSLELHKIRYQEIFRWGSSLSFNRPLNVSVLHDLRVCTHALFSDRPSRSSITRFIPYITNECTDPQNFQVRRKNWKNCGQRKMIIDG